jgi:putative transposase
MAQDAVRRAFRFRFYPTDEQAVELGRTFGCVRLVYNKALEARTAAWLQESRRVNFAESSALLTGWKKTEELSFLNEVSSVPLQQALRHLQGAFVNFWEKRAGLPRFKSRKKSKASAEYTRSAFTFRHGRLRLAKMTEPLAIVWSRPLPEGVEPSSVTVSRDVAGRWFVSMLCEDASLRPLPPAPNPVVGVDAGITALCTLSTGEKIENPRFEEQDSKRLAKAQRNLARKEIGSRNREKARVKVARAYGRVADRRRDHLHKLTTRLVRENQTVVIEDLAVQNMLGNHHLARVISDAAWSEMRRQLEYKCAWYGRTLIAIDRWYPSSKTCSGCGHCKARLAMSERIFRCECCGLVLDRDENAARNILAAGLAVTACGAGVRPQRKPPGGRSATKQETQPATVGIPSL